MIRSAKRVNREDEVCFYLDLDKNFEFFLFSLYGNYFCFRL